MKKQQVIAMLALSVTLVGSQAGIVCGAEMTAAPYTVAAEHVAAESALADLGLEGDETEEVIPGENTEEGAPEEGPGEESGSEEGAGETEEPSEPGSTDNSGNPTENEDNKKPEETKPEKPKPEKPKPEETKPEKPKPEETKPEKQDPEENPIENTTTEETPEEVPEDQETVEEVPAEEGQIEASESFVSWIDKVKYSVDTPIEGLPTFINQEMVVGALKSQDEYGIPASVTIAQIIQESGFGVYGEGGENGQGLSYLAYEYNNLFGVKGIGTAGTVMMKTGEEDKFGNAFTAVCGFRSYHTITEAIEDRAEILTKFYADLTEGVTDANTYAMKIAGRWATGHKYAVALISHMVKYDLYRLDEMTLQDYSEMVSTFVNPCPGSTPTSGFGMRDIPVAGATAFHAGIDLGTGTYNLPTYAAASGVVTYAGYDKGAGNMIIIDHGDGLVTKYMHHAELYVKAGDEVVQGQQIGLSGTTGVSTGNHLHFQVEENGVPVNPAKYFDQPGKTKKLSKSEKAKQAERIAKAKKADEAKKAAGARTTGV